MTKVIRKVTIVVEVGKNEKWSSLRSSPYHSLSQSLRYIVLLIIKAAWIGRSLKELISTKRY